MIHLNTNSQFIAKMKCVITIHSPSSRSITMFNYKPMKTLTCSFKLSLYAWAFNKRFFLTTCQGRNLLIFQMTNVCFASKGRTKKNDWGPPQILPSFDIPLRICYFVSNDLSVVEIERERESKT